MDVLAIGVGPICYQHGLKTGRTPPTTIDLQTTRAELFDVEANMKSGSGSCTVIRSTRDTFSDEYSCSRSYSRYFLSVHCSMLHTILTSSNRSRRRSAKSMARGIHRFYPSRYASYRDLMFSASYPTPAHVSHRKFLRSNTCYGHGS